MDNLTDQQHIDALSEPVKDVIERLHQVAAGTCREKYNGIFISFDDIALIPKPTPKPSPKLDSVEKLADEIDAAYSQTPQKVGHTLFTLRYIIDRGVVWKKENSK